MSLWEALRFCHQCKHGGAKNLAACEPPNASKLFAVVRHPLFTWSSRNELHFDDNRDQGHEDDDGDEDNKNGDQESWDDEDAKNNEGD